MKSNDMDDHRHNDEAILAELRGFKELFIERTGSQDKRLASIEAQTMKTNGRVTVLEMIGAEARGKAKVSGIVWGGITAVGVSVISFFINKNL